MFVRRLATAQPKVECQYTYGCPDILEMTDGDFAVIGEDLTGHAGKLPPGSGCAPHERIVRVPRELLIRAKAAIPGPT